MKEAQREDEHRTTRENNKKLKNRREPSLELACLCMSKKSG